MSKLYEPLIFTDSINLFSINLIQDNVASESFHAANEFLHIGNGKSVSRPSFTNEGIFSKYNSVISSIGNKAVKLHYVFFKFCSF